MNHINHRKVHLKFSYHFFSHETSALQDLVWLSRRHSTRLMKKLPSVADSSVWRWSPDNKSKFCTVTVHNCHQPREFLVYLLLWQWGSNEIGSNWKKMILTVIINNGLLMRLVEWPFQILHLTPIFWYSTGHIRVGTLSQALMLSAFSPVIDL